jgi:hypothetical protein
MMPDCLMRTMALNPMMRCFYRNQVEIRGRSHREGAAQNCGE